jgi:hypothetical protein
VTALNGSDVSRLIVEIESLLRQKAVEQTVTAESLKSS